MISRFQRAIRTNTNIFERLERAASGYAANKQIMSLNSSVRLMRQTSNYVDDFDNFDYVEASPSFTAPVVESSSEQYRSV